jgi:hypothetical protein
MDDTAPIAEIDARMRTGRPLASSERIAKAERAINRKLAPAKSGPKPLAERGENHLVEGLAWLTFLGASFLGLRVSLLDFA